MKKNVGSVDTIIRVILAIAVAVLYFRGYINGKAAIVLGVLAVVLLVTGVVGVCPLYYPLGINTKKQDQPK